MGRGQHEQGNKGSGRRGRATQLLRTLSSTRTVLDPFQGEDRPDAAFEAKWRQTIKARLLVVLLVLGAWVVGIEARLIDLQVFKHDEYLARALRHQQRRIPLEALRGDITDRAGRILAYSVDADSITADPSKVVDPAHTAAAVCAALGDCTARERAELTKKLSSDRQYMPIRQSRAVSPSQVRRVAELKLPGIVFPTDTRRYYPNYELAAHVLGFVGMDNTGQAGIEYSFDKTVRGEDGLAFVQVDARRQRLETHVERAPLPGATLELTLDLYLQHIVERELKAGIDANRAAGGTAVVMDPFTGEILALASYPTFNPNAAGRSSTNERRNRAIQDVYEPGSTFKIVTASAAIEEGVIAPSDLIDTNPGYITFPGRKPIRDTHSYGVISFENVIVKSSNVGAIKAGLRVGAERLSRYVHRFGFGEVLAPDFSGASRGIWNSSNLNDSALASVSMGYQVSVTPLQMTMAASAIANGGLLMEPHLVRAVIRDGQREIRAPRALRRAITAKTAATMTAIMEGVTGRGGTATAAALDRYQVAGKTGTAHKIIDGRYSDSDYNASFVGFVPSRRPAFTILVVIDTPKAAGYYGGAVAAPIFKRIADAALRQDGVPPTIAPAPPVVIEAKSRTLPRKQDPVTALIPVLAAAGERTSMPDVRGQSAREAVRTLAAVGLSVRVSGSGFVVRQTPEPGEPIDSGAWSSVELQRSVEQAAAHGGTP